MKPTKIICLALLAVAASSLTASAKPTVVCPTSYFKLKVKAALTRVITPADSPVAVAKRCPVPIPITFIGQGKAKSDRQGVTIKFAVLDAKGQRGEATIRVNNPVKYRRGHRNFAGRAAAKVRVGNSSFAFGLALKGVIKRTDDGRLLMHGKFASRRSSVHGSRFAGRFGGVEIKPTTAD